MKQNNNNQNENHSITRARVLYADIDKMGIVYHANYLRWFEAGRGSYMRKRGRPYSETEKEGIQLPLIEANISYYKPAKYEQIIEIKTWVKQIGTVQLEFNYEITCQNELLVKGFTRHAAINKQGRPVRIPANVVEALLSKETIADEDI
jgi:acyl-CoA thioester hydrolase